MSARVFRSTAAVMLMGLLGAACGTQDGVTAPARIAVPAHRSADLTATDVSTAPGQANKLVCPTDVNASGTMVVGPAGGTISVQGVRVDFPAGAVPTEQAFTAHVIGGTYIDIELTAGDSAHYYFAAPVTVTIDLSRCGSLPEGLRAWYMDSQTKALLEDMGGQLDLTGRTLRFTTPHFSGYTVGW
jgi:hypothetical protein